MKIQHWNFRSQSEGSTNPNNNMQTIRAKFNVTKLETRGKSKIITLLAVAGGTPEDNSFAAATPSATLNITIDNPAAQGFFRAGNQYYADFTNANQPVPNPTTGEAEEPAPAPEGTAEKYDPTPDKPGTPVTSPEGYKVERAVPRPPTAAERPKQNPAGPKNPA